jgi:hypothetical protein
MKYQISSRQKHERNITYHPVEVKRATNSTREYNGAQAPIRIATHESTQESPGNQNGCQRSIHTIGKYREHKKCDNQRNNQYQKVQVGVKNVEVKTVPDYCAPHPDEEGYVLERKPSCYKSLEQIPAESNDDRVLNSVDCNNNNNKKKWYKVLESADNEDIEDTTATAEAVATDTENSPRSTGAPTIGSPGKTIEHVPPRRATQQQGNKSESLSPNKCCSPKQRGKTTNVTERTGVLVQLPPNSSVSQQFAEV